MGSNASCGVPTVVTHQTRKRQLFVGVVFTLDDTLFDSTGTLAEAAFKAFVRQLALELPELAGSTQSVSAATRIAQSALGSHAWRIVDVVVRCVIVSVVRWCAVRSRSVKCVVCGV